MNFVTRTKEWFADLCRIGVDEMKTILKDEGVLIFFILVPLLYPLLYSWIYTNEVVREVPVVVVDHSHSVASREFIRQFDASPDVKVAGYCNNLEEAKDAIGRQDAFGVIYFPTDYQTNIMRMEQSRVSVFCDMSFMLYYKAVFQTATAVAGELNAKIQTERAGNHTDREDEITVRPLDFAEVQIFNSTGGYGTFIIPGVLMLIIQQTLLLGIGLLVGTARERSKSGSFLPQVRGSGGIFRAVLGRASCYFAIYAVVTAYIALVVPRLFGYVSLLRPFDTFMFMLPYISACVFFAMTVSCAVRYRENVILIVVFTSVPLLFMSGVSWPQSAIPEFWQWFGALFPSTFGIRGFVRMNTMGALLGDVRPEYAALWLQTIAYFALTCLLYCRQAARQSHR